MSGLGAPGAQDAAHNTSSSSSAGLPPHPPHLEDTGASAEPRAQDAPPSASPGRVARTWVRVARAFVLIFPVYALGYFEFSVSWLLIGLAIFFFWRRNSGCKSSRLSRALAFLQQQQQQMEQEEEEERKSGAARALDATELPSWVSLHSALIYSLVCVSSESVTTTSTITIFCSDFRHPCFRSRRHSKFCF